MVVAEGDVGPPLAGIVGGGEEGATVLGGGAVGREDPLDLAVEDQDLEEFLSLGADSISD